MLPGGFEVDKGQRLRIRDYCLKLINKINDALKRIGDGTYGCREETRKEIGIEMAQVCPATKILLEALEGPQQSGRHIQVKRQSNTPFKGRRSHERL